MKREIKDVVITPEQVKAAIQALKKCKKQPKFREKFFKKLRPSDDEFAGLMSLMMFYKEHGDTGGRVSNLLRASGALEWLATLPAGDPADIEADIGEDDEGKREDKEGPPDA